MFIRTLDLTLAEKAQDFLEPLKVPPPPLSQSSFAVTFFLPSFLWDHFLLWFPALGDSSASLEEEIVM